MLLGKGSRQSMGRAALEEEEYEDGKPEEEEEVPDVGRAGVHKGGTIGRGSGGEGGGRKPATTPKGGSTCGTHTRRRMEEGDGDTRRMGVGLEGSILLFCKSSEETPVILGEVSAGLHGEILRPS